GADRIAAFDEVLTKLEQNHQGDLALQLLSTAADKAGLSVEQVKAMLPQYTAATGAAADATGGAAAQTTALNRAQLAAVDSGQTLLDVWNELHGTMKSADEAMLDAINATDELKKSFEENGRAVDGNSKGAVSNRIALENQAHEAYKGPRRSWPTAAPPRKPSTYWTASRRARTTRPSRRARTRT